MAPATLYNAKVEIQCELDLPAGFRVAPRLNPNLAYPFELGGITNAEIPPGEASPGDTANPALTSHQRRRPRLGFADRRALPPGPPKRTAAVDRKASPPTTQHLPR
jgi:hypothetical protein